MTTPTGTAWALIEYGFCTGADGNLTELVGKSAAWAYGRIRFEGWRATMLPAADSEPPPGRQ